MILPLLTKKTCIAISAAIVLFAAVSFGASVNAQLLPGYGGGPGGDPVPGTKFPSSGSGPGAVTSVSSPTITKIDSSTVVGPTVSLTGYCQGFTATATGNTKLGDLFRYFTCMIQRMIVPLLMALGGLFFVIGMVKFITSGESEERAEGKQFMIWGVVGFSVIFSIWGLVTILKNTFLLDNASPQVPTMTKVQNPN